MDNKLLSELVVNMGMTPDKEQKLIGSPLLYSYQRIPREEHRCLLINGEETAELDFTAMHGNLLLNRD